MDEVHHKSVEATAEGDEVEQFQGREGRDNRGEDLELLDHG